MVITLCTDENFSIPALVCITSVIENNKDQDIRFCVLTDGLSHSAKQKFEKLSHIYRKEIRIITIDKRRFEGLVVNDRFPISMYYRFLIPEILSEESRVLYLDCDIIVRHSLEDLIRINLSGKAMGAVIGQSCDNLYWANHLTLSSPYFNSGVLLMNLEYWRKNNVTEQLVKWVHDNPEKCDLPDQNALNKVLEGNVVYMNYTYNFQEWWFGELTRHIHYSKWHDIKKIATDPIIVHYCEAEKPWFKECKNPYQSDFIHYATLHPFVGFKLQKRYDTLYQCTILFDKIGIKLRYWAEKWQKGIIKRIHVS